MFDVNLHKNKIKRENSGNTLFLPIKFRICFYFKEKEVERQRDRYLYTYKTKG